MTAAKPMKPMHTLTIDHSIMLAHRRFRQMFAMATIERHSDRLCAAIYARVSKARA